MLLRTPAGGTLALGLAVAAAFPTAVHGVSTWSGGHFLGPDSMSNSLNWSGGTPLSGDPNLSLVFPNSASSFTPSQNITTTLSLQSMSVTGPYTFGGPVGNGYQFSNLGNNPSLSVTGTAQFNTPVTFSAPTAFSIAGNATFNGLIGGSGALNLSTGSSGQLTLGGGGSNPYGGTINVPSNVSLILNKPGGVATQGAVVSTGGAIYGNLANQFGANSDVTLGGIGSLQLNASQTVRNLTLGTGGSVAYNVPASFIITGSITQNAGGGAIGNNQNNVLNFNGGARTISVTSTAPGDSLTINAGITNGTFLKTGPGTLNVFAPINSFSGQNVVSAGILRGAVDSIGADVLNNATVELAGGGTFSSTIISGTGQVVVPGSFVQFNAPQTYTGGTDITFAGYVTGEASTLSGDYTSTLGGGTVQINQPTNATLGATFSGAVTVRKYMNGVLTVGGVSTNSGGFELYEGGLRIASDTATGNGTLGIGFGPAVTIEALGVRNIAQPLQLGSGTITVVGSGDFGFSHPAAKTLAAALVHNSSGSTTIDGKFTTTAASAITVNSGTLTLGDPATVGGFVAAGPITVNGGTLSLRSLNFISLPDVTLAGGTLNAPNGYAIPLGAALQGSGGVTGRVASANGSTILATGALVLGDAAHSAGVNLDGELYTGTNTVTLADSNQAVLGSLTQLGTGAGDGTLNAPNGAILNFGRNLTGRGQVNSVNALARAVLINGDVNGLSPANDVEFTGYVKGVGTFNNVLFSGTFAPGFSPALLTVGTVTLSPSSTLEMEIGGLVRGGQYDALDVTGTLALGGTLQLTLINAFLPSLGDQFDLIDGPSSGTFAAFSFPPLPGTLQWDTSLLYTQGIVEVVPEPACVGLLLGALALRRRRR